MAMDPECGTYTGPPSMKGPEFKHRVSGNQVPDSGGQNVDILPVLTGALGWSHCHHPCPCLPRVCCSQRVSVPQGPCARGLLPSDTIEIWGSLQEMGL